MESQNLTEKVIVHNLNPEETTGLDPSRQYRDIPNPYQIPDIQQSVEEFIKPTEITPEPIKTPEVKKETKPVKIDNKLIAWCMPASIREEVNPLYGEIKRSIVTSIEAFVPNLSIAPALIKLSSDFLFTFARSTLFAKSERDLNGPSALAFKILSIAAPPIFLIAERPNLIA
jgi:hypothetical protein